MYLDTCLPLWLEVVKHKSFVTERIRGSEMRRTTFYVAAAAFSVAISISVCLNLSWHQSPQETGSYFAGLSLLMQLGSTPHFSLKLNPKKNGIEYLQNSQSQLNYSCAISESGYGAVIVLTGQLLIC